MDTVTLKASWRVTPDVSRFIRKKFDIDFNTNLESPNAKKRNTLKIIQDPAQLNNDLLTNTKILYYPSSTLKAINIENYQIVNWSYSKGDTYKQTIVVLTDNLKDICNDDWSASILGDKIRNQLYVALTRSSGNVYIVPKKIWNIYHNIS